MPKYIIERDLQGAGKLSQADLKGMAQRSNQMAAELSPTVHWLESYVTADKIFCVYISPDDKQIEEHAKKGKFPCTKISKVESKIDRTTAE